MALSVRGYGSATVDGDLLHASHRKIETRLKSTWSNVFEVLRFSGAYVRKGDEPDTAGMTRAASLCYTRGYQFTYSAFAAAKQAGSLIQRAQAEAILREM